ncbi:Ankyrin repeat protein 1 [Giardia muris]|uniref:Ankyrin repeat protein 1 n=1 Tax=Giardia muris TaxID=5742 RepID=A0A4Z1SYI0_GIAMU|nr:Ankyrin repeat protein 1 [Giardia muris]|eukprot:TNJ26723.1 Ankyrin repeat protein 1 [Giardia muris]
MASNYIRSNSPTILCDDGGPRRRTIASPILAQTAHPRMIQLASDTGKKASRKQGKSKKLTSDGFQFDHCPPELAEALRNDDDAKILPYLREISEDQFEEALQYTVTERKPKSLAALCRCVSIRELYVTVGPRDMTPVKSETPLMKAAQTGNATAVANHLSHANKRLSSNDPWQTKTALMMAAQQGVAECIELLLCELGGQREDGWSALIHAMIAGHKDAIELLRVEIGVGGVTRLMVAASLNDVDAVRAHINEAGQQAVNGFTALIFAAKHGYTDCINILLPHEARLQLDYGTTALMVATSNSHVDAVNLLMTKEARMQDINGWSALMIAAYEGDDAIVYLLSAKELRLQRHDGMTATMMAALNGNIVSFHATYFGEEEMTTTDGKTVYDLVKKQRGVGYWNQLFKPVKKPPGLQSALRRNYGAFDDATFDNDDLDESIQSELSIGGMTLKRGKDGLIPVGALAELLMPTFGIGQINSKMAKTMMKVIQQPPKESPSTASQSESTPQKESTSSIKRVTSSPVRRPPGIIESSIMKLETPTPDPPERTTHVRSHTSPQRLTVEIPASPQFERSAASTEPFAVSQTAATSSTVSKTERVLNLKNQQPSSSVNSTPNSEYSQSQVQSQVQSQTQMPRPVPIPGAYRASTQPTAPPRPDTTTSKFTYSSTAPEVVTVRQEEPPPPSASRPKSRGKQKAEKAPKTPKSPRAKSRGRPPSDEAVEVEQRTAVTIPSTPRRGPPRPGNASQPLNIRQREEAYEAEGYGYVYENRYMPDPPRSVTSPVRPGSSYSHHPPSHSVLRPGGQYTDVYDNSNVPNRPMMPHSPTMQHRPQVAERRFMQASYNYGPSVMGDDEQYQSFASADRLPNNIVAAIKNGDENPIRAFMVRLNDRTASEALRVALDAGQALSLNVICTYIAQTSLLTSVPARRGRTVSSATSLMLAAERGDIWTIRSSLAQEAGAVYNGKTALMIAAIHGREASLKELLVELGIQGIQGETALIYALCYKRENCAKLLLAERSIPDITGTYPVTHAVRAGLGSLLSVLRNP